MTVISRTLVAVSLFTASVASADVHGAAAAGGGLEAIDATLRGQLLEVKSGGGPVKSIMLPLGKPDLANARITTVAIGDGKHVLHVRAAEGKSVYEAILAGNGKDPIFSGLTGYTNGEDGERSGQVVIVTDRDDATKFVLIGDVREDTRICGQASTPITMRALDPKSMQLRGASVHRIEKKERDAATPIVATTSSGKLPLGRLLSEGGGSANVTRALTDGRGETYWHEDRSGDGHGEFVTLKASTETPLHSLLITVTPPSAADKNIAAPRTFFVATDQKLFHVTMPEDAALKPGAEYEVPFPEPIKTSCVTIILDEAYNRDLSAPVVAIAELSALTKFDIDGASRTDVAKALNGPRADEASAILRRGNDDALAAVSAEWASLDPRGRAYAIDVASSSAEVCTSTPAMALLTRALADGDREVKKRARGRIERCGKRATDALAVAVRSAEEPRRAASAGLLAAIAPAAAWDPLSEQIGRGTTETRHAVRAALGRAAAVTPREKLIALLKSPSMTVDERLDALRAIGPRLEELKPEAEAAIAEVLAGNPNLRTRYLACEPLAFMGDNARLGAMMKSDPEWPVRARAIEVSRNNPGLASEISAALGDPEPRVREASLRAFGPNAGDALAHDEWSFVRVAAADSLGALGQNTGALANALHDPSVKVRAAAVKALGTARAKGEAAKIRERLDDTKEDVEVRALAARILGQLCVQNAADRLTKLAILAKTPVDEADERLGTAALDALAMLHPRDLEKRLAPLREKGVRTLLKRAADRAVTDPGSCPR